MDVQDLTVSFGGVRSLVDVTLSLEDSVCGIIGPNGAGKTTFFNVVSGFVRPHSGTVRFDGEDLLVMSPHQRARWGLRRTFQQARLVDGLSVGDNMRVAIDQFGHARENRSDRITGRLQELGLYVDLSARVAALDARERRLLEIARCLVGRPRLLLLDEPGAGLDEDEAQVLAGLITDLPRRSGAMVLLVDHDMVLVSATCTSVAVLDFGRLIKVGPHDEVLSDREVRRAYLGDPGRTAAPS